MENKIIKFENNELKLDVNMKDDTVWLSQQQMSQLFNKDRTVITRHISNIFKEGELDEISNVQKIHIANSDKPITIYSLDVIISVGYRVKSKQGIIFRKWANKVLKDYIIKGYVVNEKRLAYLEKTVQLIDVASRINDDNLNNNDAKSIIKTIKNYSDALSLLDDYDHRTLIKPKGIKSDLKVTYDDCKNIINQLRFNEESDLFALERDHGLKSIIDNIYQTFGGEDVYPSIQEKAANFLYLITKNHSFIDGNKRIAATLFIYFLLYYDLLYQNNQQIIDNNTLVAITLLIAESNPKEKEIMIDLIMNFLN